MKKILAVLCGVAMIFSSCENGGNNDSKPNFPDVQVLDVQAGKTYKLTFTTENPWSITLSPEAQQYATLYYDGFTDTQHAGPAGENSIRLNVRSDAGSYVSDIIFSVDITISRYTEKLIECHIAKSTKVINVTGGINPGSGAISTLTKGGHPENGPFADALNTYTVTHYKGLEATGGEFYVQHDVDLLYNYEVYVKDKTGNFVLVDTSEGSSSSWVSMMQFGVDGEQKFRLYMDYTKSSAIKTPGVGYEAYVNIVDATKTVLVSVYHLFNPDTEVVTETSFGLANPELAAEKGVTFVGNGNYYTMTIPSLEVLLEGGMATAFKLTGFSEVNPGFVDSREDLLVTKSEEASSDDVQNPVHVYTLNKRESVADDKLVRTYTLALDALADAITEYRVTIILAWAEEAPNEDTPVEESR